MEANNSTYYHADNEYPKILFRLCSNLGNGPTDQLADPKTCSGHQAEYGNLQTDEERQEYLKKM